MHQPSYQAAAAAEVTGHAGLPAVGDSAQVRVGREGHPARREGGACLREETSLEPEADRPGHASPSSSRIPITTALPRVSVVVPVYNSQGTLRQLADRLRIELPQVSSQFEIVLVNDGSRDPSWERISELAEEYPEVTGINLMRNYGQQSALLAGIRAARFDILVTLDDDLQHPPEEIPHLLAGLTDSYDVVYGTFEEGQHGLWRDAAARLTRLALSTVMGVKVGRSVTAFRAFRAELRDAFAGYQSPFVSIDVLLTWATTRFTATPVRHDPRASGVSNYTFPQLLHVALNLTTAFSTLPLRLASLMGFALTLFGIAVLAWVVGRYLVLGYSVPGFPFLASIISIFSGAQMFALGIIGEYLARMHVRMLERPPYVIRSRTAAREHEWINV